MQPEDLAILGDPDKFLTLDFLYAIQTCDIPEFRTPNNDCMSPKLKASTIVMESTPQCVVDSPRWHQPAIIIGECVDQIGDVTRHPPVANRTLKHTLWTRPDHWEQQIPPGKLGPLWDATDFRHGKSVPGIYSKKGRNNLHTAVHLHNFFASFATLRHKYITYGHPIVGADRMPLHQINGDLGTLANCLTRTQLRKEKDARITHTFDELLPYDHRPIALQRAPAYAHQRHEEFLTEYQLDQERLASGKSTTVVT